MKTKLVLSLLFLAAAQRSIACEACQRQQPAITRGITHGTGPESNWDWLIVCIMLVIVLLSFFFSIRFLVKPGEKAAEHIKRIAVK